jgi:hypothetical protein
MEASTRFVVTPAIRILEGIFAFGILGFAVVVILAGIEDLREVFKKDVAGTEGAE